MALLTKSIGIVTPLILSIVVVVAPRLILYTETLQTRRQIVLYIRENLQEDKIVLYRTKVTRSYHTWALVDGKRKKENRAVQLVCRVSEVQT